MKKIPSILLFAFLFWFPTLSNAQLLSTEDILGLPSELLTDDLNGEGNSAYIRQIGDNNELELIQEHSNDAELNLTRVLQNGDFNAAILELTGSANQAILIQDGQDNFYHLTLEGNNNNIAVLQKGDNNTIIQKLINSNQVNAELIQEGNGNEIIHILEGINTKNYQIIQKGDNLKIEIKQSSF